MQNRNILRWLAAAVIALLVAYLRVTGYLPESEPEAANEAQTVAESESAVALEAQTTSAGRPTRSSSTLSATVTATGSAICRDLSQSWIISMTVTLQGVKISE